MFKLMLTNLQSKCKFKLLVLTIVYTGLGVFIYFLKYLYFLLPSLYFEPLALCFSVFPFVFQLFILVRLLVLFFPSLPPQCSCTQHLNMLESLSHVFYIYFSFVSSSLISLTYPSSPSCHSVLLIIIINFAFVIKNCNGPRS